LGRKYASLEIDFTGCEHLNTPELRRRIWELFEREVVSASETWRGVLSLGLKPRSHYAFLLHRIEEFKSGARDDVPFMYVHAFGRHVYLGSKLVLLPGERHLIEKLAPKVNELFDSLESRPS